MKLKQLFLAVTITLFAISCTKQDTFTPQPSDVKTESVSTKATSSVGTTSEPNLKAYIFIEPQSKLRLIVDYLKTTPRSAQTTLNTPFYGFFTGLSIKTTNYTDLLNYIDIPVKEIHGK